jgi:DNA gyrase subunit A
MLPIDNKEKITSMVAVTEFSDDQYLVMLTRNGLIKKTALSAFSNIRSNGLIAISLSEGDQLRWVRLAKAEDSIIIGSGKGMAIHFKADEQQLRPLGRATRGVKAMKLRKGDEIISMDVLPSQISASIAVDTGEEDEEELIPDTNDNGPWLLAITTGGYGKRVPIKAFRMQKRAGIGLKLIRFRKEKEQLAAIHVVNEVDELMLITSRGIIIRQAVNAISLQSRAATGVRVQRLDQEDAIAAVALVPPSSESEEVSADIEEENENEI